MSTDLTVIPGAHLYTRVHGIGRSMDNTTGPAKNEVDRCTREGVQP